MQRSFASLTAQEALHVGICIEDRNAELYHGFAELFTEFGDEESLEIAAVFWEMAIEERSHSAMLKQKYFDRHGDAACPITEHDMMEIIEVPRLETADVLGSSHDGIPGRVRALNVALQAELAAQHFYSKLAQQTAHGPLRDLFWDLADMEDSHVAYLENKLSQDAVERPTLH